MTQQNLNIVLCGTGTVGGTLLEQLACEQKALQEERGLNMQVVGVVDIFNLLIDVNGIDLSNFQMDAFRAKFKQAPASSIQLIHDKVLEINLEDLVFVDCTASYEVAALYEDFLSKGISTVCANKVAASGPLDTYLKLKEISSKQNCRYHFETNVGAGLPVINTINALRATGDKIVKIEAVLSGTLNFIFNTISDSVSLSKAVQMAKEARYSEPDPRIDLSGVDVIRKLVILARESGYMISQEDVEKNLFVPNEYFEGSLDDFWNNLPQLDAEIEKLRKDAESASQHLRFVAKLERTTEGSENATEGANKGCEGSCKGCKASVSLERVDSTHAAYNLEGSNNIILLHTERYKPHPMIIQGYGAGAAVTAAGVFADILAIKNVAY